MFCMKRIALLNLAIDDNYGGNLQRYALVRVLQNMGCDVTHLLIMRKWTLWRIKTPVAIIKRLIERFILGKTKSIFIEREYNKRYIASYNRISSFYERYIKHTAPIYSFSSLKKNKDFDIYIVGSDQVWRERMVRPFPMKAFFLPFVPRQKKIIAYAVSLGTSDKEFDYRQRSCLKKYYERFQCVSVREISARNILLDYGWENPKAEWLVDPTFLLRKDDYIELVNSAETSQMDGKMFCYILDSTKEKMDYIAQVAEKKNLKPFVTGLHEISIEQWLRNFVDAEYIVTDSYHGFVFSMIFNKPVKLFFNDVRGNARFESLFSLLNLSINQEIYDWVQINKILSVERQKAVDWLRNALEN